MESAPPPPPASYQASVEGQSKKETRSRSEPHEEEPPLKSAKHDENSYAGKPNDEYNTIDFLGNVSGGPHAAAAEALATFSSSVGENANNANMFVHVPQSTQTTSNVSSNTNQNTNTSTPHGPPFLCPTCNTSYSRLEYLRRHERRHADIRPFTCVCGKSFSRSDVLARHKTKCRVVLAGESEAPADRKAERRTSAPRTTRSRTSSQSARKSDRDEMADLSVDPALSNAVDLSMQPPPPLEGEQTHGEVDGDSYSFPGGTNYGHHSYSGLEGEHGSQSSKPAHYSNAPASGTHGMPHRPHESKMYSQHGAPPVRGAPYVSGSAAIHPELSSRGAGMYNHTGSHTPTGNHGANSPNSNNSASSPFYAHTDAQAHASYSSSNLRESEAPTAAPSSSTSGNASNAPPFPLGKEPARYSMPASGPLSPFSNTALNSTMSPYLSAFSCARDIPHSSSPRTSSGSAPSAQNTSSTNANDAPPPSDSAS